MTTTTRPDTIIQNIGALCAIVSNLRDRTIYMPHVSADDSRLFYEAEEIIIRLNAQALDLLDKAHKYDELMNNELAELRRKAAYYDTLHLSANQEGDR